MLDAPAPGEIADVLEGQLTLVEQLRYTAVDKQQTAVQNLIDEAVALYLSTLYKLRTFE